MRVYAGMIVALLVGACGTEPEPTTACAARFARIADKLSRRLEVPVRATYTYDLSGLGSDRIEGLSTRGAHGRGQPSLWFPQPVTAGSVQRFNRLTSGEHGTLFVGGPRPLYRVSGGMHRSAAEAIRHGCEMLPGARLSFVGVTAP